jgi:DNA-binding MarR family transcriptional regulator
LKRLLEIPKPAENIPPLKGSVAYNRRKREVMENIFEKDNRQMETNASEKTKIQRTDDIFAIPVSALPPPVPKGSFDLRILQSLRRIIRAIEINSYKLVHRYNITGPQLSCLFAIQESGPLTATILARQVYLSPSTVVGILDRLEEKELICRNRDQKDRRLVHVTATEKGRKLAESAPSPLQDTLAEALQKLPEIEQVSIVLALEKVVDLMEAREIGAASVLETGLTEKETK